MNGFAVNTLVTFSRIQLLFLDFFVLVRDQLQHTVDEEVGLQMIYTIRGKRCFSATCWANYVVFGLLVGDLVQALTTKRVKTRQKFRFFQDIETNWTDKLFVDVLDDIRRHGFCYC